MIKAADISKKDIVLEAGPGKGILTKALLEKAGRVMTVEKDKKLAKFLKEKFKSYKNLEIIEGDILKIKNLKLKIKNYKVVANIPYYITSRFLKTFLQDVKHQPEKMVLMVQKEVGERILGRGKMNLLALSVQIYGQPKIIAKVSRKHFSPQPKVDSVVVLIDNISKNFFANKYNRKYLPERDFFQIAKTGYAHKRKLLLNNLKQTLSLNAECLDKCFKTCLIPEKSRAENLSLENWRCLAENIVFVDKKQNSRK